MTVVSLVFLVVCIFGAFAYGSATLMALRQATPVWSVDPDGRPCPQTSVDGVSLTMFVACTIWFALNSWAEFTFIVFDGRRMSAAEVAVIALAFLFPPLIMHLVYRETRTREDGVAVARTWRWPLAVMYVASPAIGVAVLGSIFGWWPRPVAFGRFIGSTFGILFTISSVYSTLVIVRRRPRRKTTAQRRMSNAMLVLFFIVTAIFISVALLNESSILIEIFDRVTRATPIFFLIVAVYFENRFEFYDLVIKRGVMLVATIVALGLVFAIVQPLMDQLPPGPARPWLAAMLLVPVAMALPWLSRSLSSSLDHLWFGREFTPVEAVKHLLGAMQPATGEETLIVEAERRLAEIFSTAISIRLDDEPLATAAISVEAATPSGARVRFVVSGDPTERRLLSEDLQMLRSLGGVFGFMLETMRLQQKRQEQEQRRAGAAAPDQSIGAEGAAGADQSALPVQRAQRDRLADSHRSRSCRRGGRATGRGVPLHAAAIGFGVGAARSGADVRARLSRRRAGPLRPAPHVHHRVRSPIAGASGAVDAAADTDRERGQARRLADPRTWSHRRDRADACRSGDRRGARHRAGAGRCTRAAA